MNSENNTNYKLGETIAVIYDVGQQKKVPLPLFSCDVSAGFPSPADDYIDRQLDLNELLIKNPAATFFVRVSGDSMTGAGINHNDILIVDRSLEPANGMIIITAVDGELTVKRLSKTCSSCVLVSEHPDYPPLNITRDMSLEVWGVVTSVVHQFV